MAKQLEDNMPRNNLSRGQSRVLAYRTKQYWAWDLTKIEPLNTDPDTNKTRIMMFTPMLEMRDKMIHHEVDFDQLDFRQERDYANYLEKIKEFKPHVLTFDYADCPQLDDKREYSVQLAEPAIERISQAIEDGELPSVQYFLIVGDIKLWCSNMANYYQTDGWILKWYFPKWIQLPRMEGYFFKPRENYTAMNDYDNMTEYYRQAKANEPLNTPFMWRRFSMLPNYPLRDPLLVEPIKTEPRVDERYYGVDWDFPPPVGEGDYDDDEE